MQDSGTTPLQSPGFLGALTTVHFVIIALLAVLVIIGIGYGMKLARARRAATRELEDAGHLERTGDVPAADPDRPAETGEPVPVEPPASTLIEPVAPVVEEPAAPIVQEPIAIPVEPPVAAPEPARAPFVETAAPIVPAAPAGSDLTRLKGLGPKVAAMLVEQGVPDIATLARLQPGEADDVASRLGTFAPRMAKDRWVEQARYLAAGDIAGFEAVFGKL
ncbi:hypothetical protein ASE73_15905 [Sphingomonas sp. Leaf24]|uniref:hypothetical protein n=1 Tax=unclassified Sphingomonas TaxID=196159 RepID=UPI0006F28438|nr:MULTISPECIES: hypothetical protein [unclassified Sphingomonas]KQM20919.1 hypothetical protein ASE50_15125 [Sphingomonas sp. Leaf5]KQM93320.1 hypothetical protein ASE73_15905 [Sphingomonas sp. Leaf24]